MRFVSFNKLPAMTPILLFSTLFTILFLNSAMAQVRDPGHPWSQIDCDTNACIDTTLGRVGIGTTSPAVKLHVVGDIRDTGNLVNTNNYVYLTTDAGPLLRIGDPSATWTGITFLPGGTEKMRITSAGNVGIGTANPTARLQIEGQSGVGGQPPSNLEINHASAAADSKIWQFETLASVGGQSTFTLRTINDARSATTNAMIVERNGNTIVDTSFPNGNVGIGTTTPGALLDVNGNTRLNGALTWVTDTNNNIGTASSGRPNNIYVGNTLFSASAVYIGTQTSISGAALVSSGGNIVITSGNVGIGTTNPGAKLDVAGGNIRIANTQNLASFIPGGCGSNCWANLLQTDASNRLIFNPGGGTDWTGDIWFKQNPGTVILAISGNNVGIGTTAPTANLDIGTTNLGSTGTREARIGVSAGSNTAVFRVGQDSTHNSYFSWFANAVAGNAYTTLSTFGGNNPLVLQDAGGNVGIGTTSPQTALEVNGGVRLNTVAVKPSCSATYRGTLWFEQSASGTDDFLYACMKNSANAYNWVLVARGS